MVAFSACLSTDGVPPSCPTAIWAFCDSMALTTSSVAQLVAVQLVGIEPDAHGVLRAVGVDIADAVDAAERVLNITGDVVGNILFIHRAVGGDKRDSQDVGITGFTHGDALVLHRLRQLTQRGLQLVLHLLHALRPGRCPP